MILITEVHVTLNTDKNSEANIAWTGLNFLEIHYTI